ncbi:MAG: MarR family transcriptional regulator [Halanaerobiales bacterium]|nr:MarR family transcriptional regulator [Halanaerobiales bacterium]
MKSGSIGKYLSITHRAHTSLVDRKFKKKFNLSHGQVFILINIYRDEGICQHRLCEEYNLDKSGVGRILKKLEKKNLVIRQSDPDDKRKKLIYLTDKAKEMKTGFKKLLKEIEEQMRNGLTQEEINTIRKLLNKIYNNLDKSNV